MLQHKYTASDKKYSQSTAGGRKIHRPSAGPPTVRLPSNDRRPTDCRPTANEPPTDHRPTARRLAGRWPGHGKVVAMAWPWLMAWPCHVHGLVSFWIKGPLRLMQPFYSASYSFDGLLTSDRLCKDVLTLLTYPYLGLLDLS